MKKVLLIAAASVFVLASCKKDWTCKCTQTDGTNTYVTSTTVNGTKKDAKAACEYTLTVGTYTTTCVIE